MKKVAGACNTREGSFCALLGLQTRAWDLPRSADPRLRSADPRKGFRPMFRGLALRGGQSF